MAKEMDIHAWEGYRKANQCRVNASPCREVRPTNVLRKPWQYTHAAYRQVMMSALFVSHWPLYRYSGSRRRAALGRGTPLLRRVALLDKHFTVHSSRLSQGCPGLRNSVYVPSARLHSTPYGTSNRKQSPTLANRAPFESRWHTQHSNPIQGVAPRGPAAPTKMTSVMATRAKSRASLALSLACNAVHEASKLSPMTTAMCRSNFMLQPLHPSNQEWPLS